jgi:hypothetical protein
MKTACHIMAWTGRLASWMAPARQNADLPYWEYSHLLATSKTSGP